MNYQDHERLTSMRYQHQEVLVECESGLVRVMMSKRSLRLVLDWADAHHAELVTNCRGGFVTERAQPEHTKGEGDEKGPPPARRRLKADDLIVESGKEGMARMVEAMRRIVLHTYHAGARRGKPPEGPGTA